MTTTATTGSTGTAATTTTATIGIGVLSEFDAIKDDITSYIERFELYCLVNNIIHGDVKRALFLSNVGATTYKLLRSLSDHKPLEKNFDELVQLLKNHLQPKPNVIAQRFKFFKRDRKQGESISVYISDLRTLSEHCEFNENLDEYLRDRLVCGVNNE